MAEMRSTTGYLDAMLMESALLARAFVPRTASGTTSGRFRGGGHGAPRPHAGVGRHGFKDRTGVEPPDPVLTFRDGDAMVRVVLERDGTNWGAPVYRYGVDVDVAVDGADAPAALEGPCRESMRIVRAWAFSTRSSGR